MKQTQKTVVLLTLLLAAGAAAAATAQSVELLAPGPRDLAASDLVASPGLKAVDVSREPPGARSTGSRFPPAISPAACR